MCGQKLFRFFYTEQNWQLTEVIEVRSNAIESYETGRRARSTLKPTLLAEPERLIIGVGTTGAETAGEKSGELTAKPP